MMIYDLAEVEDKGSYWEIVGVVQNNLSVNDLSKNFLKMSAVSGELTRKALLEGQEVRVYKPLLTNEVIPTELKFVLNKEDDIQNIRNSEIKRVRMLINPELASVSGLAYYGFMCLNNELADKGFFITESNREAKYLSILETGDEKLIEMLERYLNYRDEIGRVSALHKSFEGLRKDILNEEDPAKIVKMSNEFMDLFYSRF